MRKYDKQMPPNWKPPVPAWSASIQSDCQEVIIGYFGYQIKDDQQATEPTGFLKWFTQLLKIENAPIHTERGRVIDDHGYLNGYFISYWDSETTYKKWRESSGFTEWWNATERVDDDFGYWAELMVVPTERFETLFSSENKAGAAEMFDKFEGPIQEHNYFGGMRDRLKISAVNLLESNIDNLVEQSNVDSIGKRIFLRTPKNLAIIRSAQNLTETKGDELERYNRDVYPHLIKGMDFISKNSEEVGCCSSRFSEELTLDGEPTKKTFGFAYFLTLGHLEKWSKTHPTHLAIFHSFLKMAEELRGDIKIKLWHEVSVLPEGQIFEYINCHPKTGLLPWFK